MLKKEKLNNEKIQAQKLQEAQTEGELNKATEVARNLLEYNLKISDIARITGLSLEQIKAISNDTTTID